MLLLSRCSSAAPHVSVWADPLAGPVPRSLQSRQRSAPMWSPLHSPRGPAARSPPRSLLGLLPVYFPSRTFLHMNPPHARPSLALHVLNAFAHSGYRDTGDTFRVSQSRALLWSWWQPRWPCSAPPARGRPRTRERAPLLLHSGERRVRHSARTRCSRHWSRIARRENGPVLLQRLL